MSDAAEQPSDRELRPAHEKRHESPLKELHTGDVARVTFGEKVLDPAAVIAVWPWSQEDFTPTEHPEIELKDHETLSNHRYDSDDDIRLWEMTGQRVTFATEDGARYAVVDWNSGPDTAFLYLLVIDSECPDERRWDRVGEVDTVERYGEPEDREAEWIGRLPNADIPPWRVEQDADPSFTLDD